MTHALIVLGPNPLENWVLVPTSGEKSHHAFRAELRSPLLRQDEGKSGIQKTTEKIISQSKMSNHKLRVAAMDTSEKNEPGWSRDQTATVEVVNSKRW